MTTEAAQSTTLVIDNAHTLVEFAVKHMMFTTVKGRFGQVEGTIIEHRTNHALSAVNVTIQVASIDTRDEKRDAHLRSADFFEADTFPTIVFNSTRVVPKSGDDFDVYGNLTIKQATKEVVLHATRTGEGRNPWGMTAVGFTAETRISRKDFGLTWNVALETGGVLVGEEIRISLEVEAIKQ
jgi:polyisoprenoid-binding protein YceI